MMGEKKDEVIAVIPARAGSKGVLGKNMRLWRGRPLWEWSLAYAILNHDFIDRIILTTDIEDLFWGGLSDVALPLMDKARRHGWVRDETRMNISSHRRKAYASGDLADDRAVVHNLLKDEYISLDDTLVWLRPTSPKREYMLMKKMLQAWETGPFTSLRVVRESTENPYKMHMLGRGIDYNLFHIRPFYPNRCDEPRQLTNPSYWQTGLMDIVPAWVGEPGNTWAGERPGAYITTQKGKLDIDSEADFVDGKGD